VLIEVAERMRASVRESDTVARLGGDEFVVLLDSVDEDELIGRVAQKLIDQMRLPIRLDDAVLTVGASVGISRFVGDGTSAAHFIDSADGAMYRAKQAGGSSYEFCA
jgi:diguanylate cyclase (GGDEF)-like protein